jgi:hypothetical protein
MSLALFASPIESKDDYLENKINKEKMKLSYESLQTQLNPKPLSAHGVYNSMNGKESESEYNMNAVYNIHKNIKDDNEKELSNFYQNEKPVVAPLIKTNQYLLLEEQDRVPQKKVDSDLVYKIDKLMEMMEEQSEIKTTKKNEEIVLYCFLGIFTIYVLDSFASIGKYSR